MNEFLGNNIKKLGFGFMRLPMIDGEIDINQTKDMVDLYMSKGFTYFDTAYVYIGGKSEVALKESLVDRYPRESFQIASKLPIWGIKEPEDMETLFNTTMERLGIDYIDFYLLHALNRDSAKKIEDFGGWEFLQKKKEEGKIKHIGFSFHDSADVLEDILTKHPESEFVQLQINYIDWESESVQSRKCYDLAIKHNKPIIIMEPVKGGTLAEVSSKAQDLFTEYNKNASASSWAIRYCASFDNILTVLSGMSNMEQLSDNVLYMENFIPLCPQEREIIDQVVEVINSTPTIPCTDCKYCVDGCPMKINIPRLFRVMNNHKKFGSNPDVPKNVHQFMNSLDKEGKPSECIECGLCEEHCPQQIEIINELKEIARIYEV